MSARSHPPFAPAVLALLVAATAGAGDPSRTAARPDRRAPAAPAAAPPEAESGRLVTAYVVLEGEPLVAAARGGGVSAAAAASRLAAIRAGQERLRPALEAREARVDAAFARVANALQVRVPAGRLEELATLPGVARVERVSRYVPATASSVASIGVPEVWRRGAGGDGEGVRIGIVDTGIDYTHADLGGSGDPAAYAANDPEVIEPGTFPTAKVAGGWDFAGDTYDSGWGGQAPAPDPDPLDVSGHGTHVAGVAAGVGVTGDGTPFAGPYDQPLDLAAFRIGPGVAPRARLYALKVFGSGPSTALLGAALEWAADPDGDGDLSDRLDVVNLALACAEYCGSAVEREMVDALGELGTFVAAAAGNDGQAALSVAGAASAERATAVGAVADDAIEGPGLRVDLPEAIAGTIPAARGYDGSEVQPNAPVAGFLARPDPLDACASPVAGTSLLGAVALIDAGGCEATVKVWRVQAAGAVAALLIDGDDASLELVEYGVRPGRASLPAMRVRAADGELLLAHLGDGVKVTLGPAITASWPQVAGRLAGSTARGPRLPDAALKPDLLAPGVGVVSAAAGSGSGGGPGGGTSVAAAHVAGAAALLRGLRPELSAAEIKAALMNTAARGASPQSLAGAGELRVDLAAAAAVTAAAAEPPGAVALSFGVVHAAGRTTVERQLTLTNHATSPLRLRTALRETLSRAGVTVSLAPEVVTVPPLGSAQVTVTLAVDPARLAPVVDPSVRELSEASEFHAIGVARLPETSGDVVLLDEAGGEALHVPFHALVTASARLEVATPRVCVETGSLGPGGEPGVLNLPSFGFSGHPHPVVTALELGAVSPDLGLSDPAAAAADLIAVGAASDYPSKRDRNATTLYFGLATAGEWVVPVAQQVSVLVEVEVGYPGGPVRGRAGGAVETLYTDLDDYVLVGPALYSQFTDPTFHVLEPPRPLNVVPASVLDTAPIANSVMVIAVSAAEWPFRKAFEEGGGVTYRVVTQARSGFRDETPWLEFDPRDPAVATAGGPLGPLHVDRAPVLATLGSGVAASAPPRVLLLGHMNLPGERVQIVDVALDAQGSDLRVAAAGGGAAVLPDRRVSHTITLTNAGKTSASDVALRGALSDGARYVSVSPSQGACEAAGAALSCALGSVAAGASVTLSTVVEGLAAGSFAQAVAASAAGCEAIPEDNVVELPFEVRHGVRRRVRR